MIQSPTTCLLRRVALRQWLAATSAHCHRFTLLFAVFYAVLLVTARLFALIPDWFAPGTLLVIPAAALCAAALVSRRPRPIDAAHLIDSRLDTQDLFLTTTLIDQCPEAYRDLVVKQAEAQSTTVAAAAIVPFRWHSRVRDLLLLTFLLLAAVLYLPQLDPFGRNEVRQREAKRRNWLEESRKATALRVQALRDGQTPEAKHSRDADAALEDLMKTLSQTKPDAKKLNMKQLSERQKDLGQLWRNASAIDLKDAFERTDAAQRFGAGANARTTKWKRQLQKGDLNPLREEMAELQKMAETLARSTDPKARQALRRELTRRLKTLAAFTERSASSKQLQAALNRALEQLAMCEARDGELSQSASNAARESLALAGAEMAALAQAMEDLGDLEGALQAIQMAKQLNEKGRLNGADCAGCQGIQDYAQLYEQLMAKLRQQGGGMNGPGTGKGGNAPEDDGAETDFQPDKASSPLVAGKMLMQWKTRELAKPGQARIDYREQLKAVRQGVSEAIVRERVPPGYHEGIRKYFDTMGKAGKPLPDSSEPASPLPGSPEPGGPLPGSPEPGGLP